MNNTEIKYWSAKEVRDLYNEYLSTTGEKATKVRLGKNIANHLVKWMPSGGPYEMEFMMQYHGLLACTRWCFYQLGKHSIEVHFCDDENEEPTFFRGIF